MGRINVDAKLYLADETSSQSVILDTEGRPTLEILGSADAATTFRLDVSVDDAAWITDFYVWANVTGVKEGYLNGYRFIRFRSDAAGVSGDKVSLVLTAGG